MSCLSRKSALALAAIIDIGLTARPQPLNANALAARHGLPARYLEPVLQRLVRQGILDARRGPQGGYTLARDLPPITAGDVLRVAGLLEDGPGEWSPQSSPLLTNVVAPALAEAEHAFSDALSRIRLEDLMRLGSAWRANEKTDREIRTTAENLESEQHSLDR